MTLTGKRIKRIRKGMRLNQTQFAAALGVTPVIVSYWEQEKGRPSKKNQEKILNISKKPAVKAKPIVATKPVEKVVEKPVEKAVVKPTPVVEVIERKPKPASIQTLKIENVQLGKRIKLIRTNLKMNQETFADRVGTSLQSIFNWEKGKFHPSDQFIENIAELVNIHPNELKCGSLEDFVFEYVGNSKYPLFPKATHKDQFEIIELLRYEESPYDLSTLVSVVNRYRSNDKSSSVLPGYFTTLATA